MKNKKQRWIRCKQNSKFVILIIFTLLFFLNTEIGFVDAENNPLVETSDVGVQYDKELIGQFLVSDWVHVTIDVKDLSNISIDYEKDSVEIQTTKDNQKIAILSNISNSILLTLSEDEFQLKQISEFGVFFSGNITKEGFDKLLQDERVDHIYAKKSGSAHSSISSENNFFISLLIILVIFSIILIFIIKKRKWKKKR